LLFHCKIIQEDGFEFFYQSLLYNLRILIKLKGGNQYEIHEENISGIVISIYFGRINDHKKFAR